MGGDDVNLLYCLLCAFISSPSWGSFILYLFFLIFIVIMMCHANNRIAQESWHSGNLVVIVNTWKPNQVCCRNKSWPNRDHHNRDTLLIIPFGIHEFTHKRALRWAVACRVGLFITCRYLLLWWPYRVYLYNITLLSSDCRTLKLLM